MRLPPELICRIIGDIVYTPAVFIFDLETGLNPHSPLLPQGSHVRFRPRMSRRFPGKDESLVSRTIRSLLLTSRPVRSECLRHLQGINMPTVSQQAIVRFNPRVHVICIDTITHTPHSHYPMVTKAESWVKADSNLLTELNFDIDHLAFTGAGAIGLGIFIWFRNVFPTIRHFYGAFWDRSNHNMGPVGIAFPTRDQAHVFSKASLFMFRKHSQFVRRLFLTGPRLWGYRQVPGQPPPVVPQFDDMVIT